MKNILNEFLLENGINRCGIILLNSENAIRAINISKELNISVLGIDCFNMVGERIIPFIEHSVDYQNKLNNHSLAIEYIMSKTKESNNCFYFEIVFDDLD